MFEDIAKEAERARQSYEDESTDLFLLTVRVPKGWHSDNNFADLLEAEEPDEREFGPRLVRVKQIWGADDDKV
jgi:hypothetical protein